jgi:hypothetical protein
MAATAVATTPSTNSGVIGLARIRVMARPQRLGASVVSQNSAPANRSRQCWHISMLPMRGNVRLPASPHLQPITIASARSLHVLSDLLTPPYGVPSPSRGFNKFVPPATSVWATEAFTAARSRQSGSAGVAADV